MAGPCLLGLAGCLLLAGCGSGGQETLSKVVKDADSAVATARLALDLESSGQLTSAAATTALGDMVKDINSSAALPAFTAQEAVDSTDGSPAAAEAERLLAASARDLEELSTRLGAG
ncbi:hypothetical protein ACFVTM_18520 [Arthrobacter sp. NPDC058130]|uniref:hypothetical protein n=1 Tax=Arthrobacter sp. NPDC058130 TaxID=3346353 RepID=UPI0036F15A47